MDWLGIAGLVIGLVGIPLAFIVGRRNRQVPDLRVVTDFNRIVAPGDFAGVKLAWEGQPLEQVSRTTLAFWNQRGDHVSGDSVLVSDPLRIELDANDSVLQVRLVAYSREQNALRVEGDALHFDFLDGGDGGVFEVLHCGDKPARIVGTIPGAKISEGQRGDLSAEGRAKLRTARIRRIVGFEGRRPLRFLTISTVVIVVVLVGAALLTWMTLTREPELVALGPYDLTTIDGQADFSKEVQRVGGATQSSNLVLLFGIVVIYSFGLLMVVGTLISRSRSIVPKSVVQHDADAKGSADQVGSSETDDPS